MIELTRLDGPAPNATARPAPNATAPTAPSALRGGSMLRSTKQQLSAI